MNLQEADRQAMRMAFGPTQPADLEGINLFELWQDPTAPFMRYPLVALQTELFDFLVEHRVRAASVQLLRRWIMEEGKLCESPESSDYDTPNRYGFVDAVRECVQIAEHRTITIAEQQDFYLFEKYLFGVMPGNNDAYRAHDEQEQAKAMIDTLLACYEAKDFQEQAIS